MKNWRQQREKRAFLALANGEIFRGWSFGAPVDATGEVVFNTGMTGYQEIISDPSYAGQFVTLTAPEIGNYGCNAADTESANLHLNGLIIHNLNEPSNHHSEISLDKLLQKSNVPAIAGIDTRRLTILLRSYGNQKAFLHCSNQAISEKEAVRRALDWEGLDGRDYAALVSTTKPYVWRSDPALRGGGNACRFNVAVYDFGVKYNILRQLADNDMQLTVFPGQTPVEEILKTKPDGVFLSNGPADPAAVKYAITAIKTLLGKVPLMGICLGHQLIGLACGITCNRLKFGHHGCNHPVKNLLTGGIEITSQNHNYALEEKGLAAHFDITHMNLNDLTIEGIRHRHEPVFGIQYHPESAPGPHDSRYLFKEFQRLMER
ncbi:MAG: glutamine-hydrolyzing carbamoyl-phosphate synthase small subunit [Phycisphaerales bacterium]|nr:glutamine-hydrolyzing carbamoyl-phosphate synthase small subunit [Phycisphaerales bacterium]